mgnify:CR=1 FL=1
MSIAKKYLKTKSICRTTFRISAEEAAGASAAFLVGEFNDWSTGDTPMKRLKDGSFKAEVDLPCGNAFQFRYLLDGRWDNDGNADRYCFSEFGNCENSVVEV